MQVTNVDVTIVEVPQTAPLAPYRSHYRTSSTTKKGIVRVGTDEGITGWGEFNVNFLEGISGRKLHADASAWLTGRDPQNLVAFHRDCPLDTRLKAGLEMALCDVASKAAGVPLCVYLGGQVRDEIELAACMGIQTYERAGELAQYYVERGFSTLKTKAGADMDEDVEMVRGVRDAVGDSLKLRIDPNTAYSKDESLVLAKRLEEYHLEYLEQPLPEAPLEDAAWLRKQTSTPIALNESVTDEASAYRILKADAAAVLLPDTHIAGGVLPCVTIGRMAQAAGVPCVMHCGHDLGFKTLAMAHVVAACPAYSLANDCTYYGLADDVLTERIAITNGRIKVPTTPGLGAVADMEKLKQYRVDC